MNDGGPAFPYGDELTGWKPGMTLRDWFAGQASTVLPQTMSQGSQMQNLDVEEQVGVIARLSYRVADAMIAEREKETKCSKD